jgi:hypothetical protein
VNGVPVRVEFEGGDPLLILGVACPAVGLLPLIEPLTDEIRGEGFTLYPASDASDLRLFPRVATERFMALVPKSGPATPLAADDPDLPAVVAACDARLADLPHGHGPPSVFNHADSLLSMAIEIAARSYHLPPGLAVPRVLPWSYLSPTGTLARIEAAYLDGYARPGVGSDLAIGKVRDGEAARARIKAADEARAARALLKIPRPGLLRIVRTAPVPRDRVTPFERGINQPIPMGESFWDLGALPGPRTPTMLAPGFEVSAGTFDMTDAEAAKVGPLEDGLIDLLEQLRSADGATYLESDFPDLPLTVERMHARERFHRHAAQLVRVCDSGSRAAKAFAWKAATHLIVAFIPHIGLQSAADLLCEALRAQVGKRSWPYHLPTVDSVPRALLAAIAAPGPCARGELVSSPSDADASRLAKALDPSAFNRTVTLACEGLSEVRSETVVRALRDAGLIGAHPNAEQSARISAILEREGFIKTEVTKGKGRKAVRYRAWIKPAPVIAPPEVDAPVDEVA